MVQLPATAAIEYVAAVNACYKYQYPPPSLRPWLIMTMTQIIIIVICL